MDLSTKFMYGHYTEECNDGVKYNARVGIEPEWLLLVLGNVWRPTTLPRFLSCLTAAHHHATRADHLLRPPWSRKC